MIIPSTNYRESFEAYSEAVRSGELVTGRLEKWAVQRFDEDIAKQDDPDFLFRFDWELAESSCAFFPLLKHTDGEYADKPFILYPWQVFIVANLFGWVRKDSGFRRYREAFLSMGRGNGKTPFGAGIMLLLFAFDSPIEQRAEVYTAAVKRDQAGLSFGAAKRFIEKSGLSEYVQLLNRQISIPDNGSKMEPLSADAKSADGLNIHGLLRDELHAWTVFQRDYYEKLQTALGKRRQPLAITITTAGSEESTLWREQHQHATRVVDPQSGVTEDSLFVFVCEIDQDDDELDPAVWPKANPMLEYGVVKRDHLQTMADRAANDEAARHQFRRYHANVLTFSFNKSFTPEDWAAGDTKLPLSFSSLYAGVDLGWCDDLSAVGYVAPLDWVEIAGESKRRYAVFADVFMPKGTRRDLTKPPYLGWVKSGRITLTDSEWTDTAPIYAAIRKWHKDAGIKSLAYDPANFREFALNVENEIGIPTFPFAQTHSKYHEPLKEFKIALREGRILHGGDALLGWCAQNVVEVANTSDHRMPNKQRSEDKIDPIVAVLMAFSECLFAERKRPSVYERRGPILVG